MVYDVSDFTPEAVNELLDEVKDGTGETVEEQELLISKLRIIQYHCQSLIRNIEDVIDGVDDDEENEEGFSEDVEGSDDDEEDEEVEVD